MRPQLIVAVIVEPLHSCLLDRAVHPLDLTIRPRMVWLGQSVFDPVGLADHIEPHWPRMDGVSVSGLFSELDAVICQDRVDFVRHGFKHMLQELPSSASIRRLNELGDSELAGAVNSNKQI